MLFSQPFKMCLHQLYCIAIDIFGWYFTYMDCLYYDSGHLRSCWTELMTGRAYDWWETLREHKAQGALVFQGTTIS